MGLVHKRAQREVAAAPSPAGKELGRWRQARATGLSTSPWGGRGKAVAARLFSFLCDRNKSGALRFDASEQQAGKKYIEIPVSLGTQSDLPSRQRIAQEDPVSFEGDRPSVLHAP